MNTGLSAVESVFIKDCSIQFYSSALSYTGESNEMNQGKLIEIFSNDEDRVIWGQSLIIVTLNWGNVFPKLGKWHTLTIKHRGILI